MHEYSSPPLLSPSEELEPQAQFLRALGHPVRLRILEFLGSREVCGCELEKVVALDQSTISRHLQALERAGIVSSRKEGVRKLYRVRDLALFGLLRQVEGMVHLRPLQPPRSTPGPRKA